MISRNKHAVTVQVFIQSPEGKILMVHDRGEDEKPAGWGLPGGGVDKSDAQLVDQINKFLPVYCRGDEEKFNTIPYNEEIGLSVFLTAIEEGIAETGFLLQPLSVLFEEQNAPDHKVVVLKAEIVGGSINKRSIETDDCDWFSISELPFGTYRSHVGRIREALRQLGNPELAEKVSVVMPKEEGVTV